MTGEPSYLFLAVLAGVATAFCVAPLLLARLWARWFAPPKPGPEKNAPYECGLPSPGETGVRFHSGYYLYALVFLIFDVELLFLLPFAVAWSGLPLGAVGVMLVFVLLLVEGLIWAWRKGVLEWQ